MRPNPAWSLTSLSMETGMLGRAVVSQCMVTSLVEAPEPAPPPTGLLGILLGNGADVRRVQSEIDESSSRSQHSRRLADGSGESSTSVWVNVMTTAGTDALRRSQLWPVRHITRTR